RSFQLFLYGGILFFTQKQSVPARSRRGNALSVLALFCGGRRIGGRLRAFRRLLRQRGIGVFRTGQVLRQIVLGIITGSAAAGDDGARRGIELAGDDAVRHRELGGLLIGLQFL